MRFLASLRFARNLIKPYPPLTAAALTPLMPLTALMPPLKLDKAKKAPVLLKNTGAFVFFTRPASLIGKGKFCFLRRPDAPRTRCNGCHCPME